MPAPRSRIPPALVATMLGAALLAACSSKKDGTSPPVVIGPTFNFTFSMSGTSVTRTFTEVGTWNYRCTLHSGMAGTVIVDGSSANDSVPGGVVVGPGGSQQFSPASVTIKPGGIVRWRSDSGPHTVTR
jgi:plastocyanin